MSTDPTRMCELLVGLPDVNVLAVNDTPGAPLEIWIETRTERPACPGCGGPVVVKDRPMVRLVDLPAFGRPTELCWRKYRWRCPDRDCETGSWTEHVSSIGWPRLAMTDRAGRWVTRQIGQAGRAISDVANELGCDWHTINNTIHAFGTPLLDDPERIGEVTALGLDETLFFKQGRWKRQRWATSIVDVARGVLLDMVEGRNATAPCEWLNQRERAWLDAIKYAALDLSGPYRLVSDTMIPDAVQVADPFHVVKLANQALDEVRRRVQNETLGHRGHKDDPLYRCRRLLTKAEERLDDKGRTRLMGLLEAGDPRGEVRTAWHAKELVRQLYVHTDHKVGLAWVTTLAADLQDQDCPPEVNRLGRTLHKWRHQIAAWHHAHTTNASTEAANGLIKRIKRVGLGFTNFNNYRLRSPVARTGNCSTPSPHNPAENRSAGKSASPAAAARITSTITSVVVSRCTTPAPRASALTNRSRSRSTMTATVGVHSAESAAWFQSCSLVQQITNTSASSRRSMPEASVLLETV